MGEEELKSLRALSDENYEASYKNPYRLENVLGVSAD